MATTENKLRITTYVEPVVLRMLVLPASSESVTHALTVLADQVMARTQRLAGLLSAEDWEFFQRATEAVLYDQPRETETWHGLLWRALKDAASYQSLHTEIWGSDPKGRWKELQKLAKSWDDLDAYAVMCACRFYHNQALPDVADEGWWDVGLRVRPREDRSFRPTDKAKKRPGKKPVEKP